jgi:hypothetical protein
MEDYVQTNTDKRKMPPEDGNSLKGSEETPRKHFRKLSKTEIKELKEQLHRKQDEEESQLTTELIYGDFSISEHSNLSNTSNGLESTAFLDQDTATLHFDEDSNYTIKSDLIIHASSALFQHDQESLQALCEGNQDNGEAN